jgi:hypothetical protein
MSASTGESVDEIRAHRAPQDPPRIRPTQEADMRMLARTAMLLFIFSAFVIACDGATIDGAGTTAEASACDQAFADAIALDADSDTVSAIDGVIATCQSLEAWVQGAQQHPDLLGGQDPADLAGARCAASSLLAGTPVCTEIQGN